MKFAQVELGKKARRRVAWSTLEGQIVECDVRIMTAAEDQVIMAAALAHVERVAGERYAKPGNPIYEFEVAVQGVALFTLDKDNLDAEERFFESADQVREKLERDRVNFLYDQQQEFQQALSPMRRDMSQQEWAEMVAKVAQQAEGEPDPLGTCAPSLRRIYDRTTARELLSLQTFKFSSTSQG